MFFKLIIIFSREREIEREIIYFFFINNILFLANLRLLKKKIN
jgi:hypothetical protein